MMITIAVCGGAGSMYVYRRSEWMRKDGIGQIGYVDEMDGWNTDKSTVISLNPIQNVLKSCPSTPFYKFNAGRAP